MKDMSDYQLFMSEGFIKLYQKFDIEKCFYEIKEIFEIKTKSKNLDLIINPIIFKKYSEKIQSLFDA